MKKLIVGLVAVGAVVALRPVVKRHLVQKMQAHCKQMMAAGDRGEAIGQETMHQQMREHCTDTPAHEEAPAEPIAVA